MLGNPRGTTSGVRRHSKIWRRLQGALYCHYEDLCKCRHLKHHNVREIGRIHLNKQAWCHTRRVEEETGRKVNCMKPQPNSPGHIHIDYAQGERVASLGLKHLKTKKRQSTFKTKLRMGKMYTESMKTVSGSPSQTCGTP